MTEYARLSSFKILLINVCLKRDASLRPGVRLPESGDRFVVFCLWRQATSRASSSFAAHGTSEVTYQFASRSVRGLRTLIINILRNLVQKALPFLEPLPQGFHETFVPLTAFQLRRCLRIG